MSIVDQIVTGLAYAPAVAARNAGVAAAVRSPRTAAEIQADIIARGSRNVRPTAPTPPTSAPAVAVAVLVAVDETAAEDAARAAHPAGRVQTAVALFEQHGLVSPSLLVRKMGVGITEALALIAEARARLTGPWYSG